jgi:cob(I)alamin adenosyltransferase
LKIYTRRGDAGQTDLFGGERVGKDALRVEVYGEVDELNSVVGLAAAHSSHADLEGLLQRIQSTLFDVGAHLATPDAAHREKAKVPSASTEDVDELEECIDRFEGELEPLKSFVLPGGTAAAAAFHVARTVCRRAERRAVTLNDSEPLDPTLLKYLNRLSDLLFTLARLENARAGLADVAWVGRER